MSGSGDRLGLSGRHRGPGATHSQRKQAAFNQQQSGFEINGERRKRQHEKPPRIVYHFQYNNNSGENFYTNPKLKYRDLKLRSPNFRSADWSSRGSPLSVVLLELHGVVRFAQAPEVVSPEIPLHLCGEYCHGIDSLCVTGKDGVGRPQQDWFMGGHSPLLPFDETEKDPAHFLESKLHIWDRKWMSLSLFPLNSSYVLSYSDFQLPSAFD